MKFSTKLTLLLLSVVFLLSGTVFYVIHAFTLEAMETQITDHIEDMAAHTMDEIDKLLFERQGDIQVLAGDSMIVSQDSAPEDITQRLIEFRDLYKTYVSLSFFDRDRIRIADTAGMHIGKQHHSCPWSEDALDNGVVSAARDVRIAEDLKVPCFYFAAPVRDKAGKALGAVVARMPVEKLYEIISEAFSPYTKMRVKVDLVDKEGVLLYSNHNKKGILKEKPWESMETWNLFKSGTKKTGSIRHSHPGEGEYLGVFIMEQGYLDFAGNGWVLMFHIPVEDAFAPALRLREKALFTLSLITGVAILLILFFSRAVSNTLIRLKDAALRIGKGDLDARIHVQSGDEIGQLAATFNRMAGDLKISREEILSSREYSDNIIRSLIGALIVITPDALIRTVNRAAYDLLGYKEEELLGRPAGMIFAEEEEEEERLPFKGLGMDDLIREGFVRQTERTLLTRNGVKVPVLFAGSVMRDREGKIQGVVCVALDITGQKVLEEQNKTIIRTALDGFWILDREGRILEANNSYREMVGYSREELLNMSVSEVEAMETPEEVERHIRRVMENGSDRFETRHRRKDGKIIDMEVSANFMDFEGGRLFSFVRDITERKRTEECLSSLNETFLKLGADYSQNVQSITQACGKILDASCVLYNKLENGLLCSIGQWRTPRGFNPVDKPEGHICHDLIREGKRDGAITIKNLPETGYYKTDPNVAAYGLKTYIGHAVNCGGKTVGALCAVFQEDVELGASEDITIGMLAKALENEEEREQAQKELKKINKELGATQNASLNIMADLDRQRKELDKSLREREALIREVHHRVKNNMQVISSLLKLQSYRIEDPKYQAIFKDSENRIKSMVLVHERLYRTEDLAHIDFGDYIRNLAVDIFHSFGARATHIRLHVDAENITLPIDTAIPCGLIINELITNALKYAFPLGQVQGVSGDKAAELVVEMKKISDLGFGIGDLKSEIRNPKSQIELIVRDNGVGMPEDLDFKTAPSLGLNLITSLAKQIRGEIELNREGGTEWKIRFGIADCGSRI